MLAKLRAWLAAPATGWPYHLPAGELELTEALALMREAERAYRELERAGGWGETLRNAEERMETARARVRRIRRARIVAGLDMTRQRAG